MPFSVQKKSPTKHPHFCVRRTRTLAWAPGGAEAPAQKKNAQLKATPGNESADLTTLKDSSFLFAHFVCSFLISSSFFCLEGMIEKAKEIQEAKKHVETLSDDGNQLKQQLAENLEKHV